MLEAISLGSLGSYLVFMLCLYCQNLHNLSFKGESTGTHLAIQFYVIFGTLVKFGFLIWYGYKVDFISAGLIYLAGFLIVLVGGSLVSKGGYLLLSMLGLIAVPVAGYFMFSLMPIG